MQNKKFVGIIASTVLASNVLLGVTPPTEMKLQRATYRKITLSWEPGNQTEQIAGYRIFRNGVEVAALPNQTSYTDENLQPGTEYVYTVKSIAVGGAESDSGLPLAIKTMKSTEFDGNSQVERVVDSLHATDSNVSAAALMTAVKSGFEAIFGSAVSFSVLDGELLSSFMADELAMLAEASPTLTEAERRAIKQELDTMMRESFSGNSFEDMYIQSKLTELADRHWQAERRTAAILLNELALQYMQNDEPTIGNVLHRLAYWQKLSIPANAAPEEIAKYLADGRNYSMRFFDFFPASKSIHAKSICRNAIGMYWENFPRLLAYENYHTDSWITAQQLAQKGLTLDTEDLMFRNAAERIAAWELVPMKVRITGENGASGSGSLKIENISATSGKADLFPGDPLVDERVFAVRNGEVLIPVYAGHLYDVTLNIQVAGGKDIISKFPLFAHEKGKKYIYDERNGERSEALASGATEVEFRGGQPDYAYNLSFVRNIDVFTLRWDWADSDQFRAAYFKVFRGSLPIATVTGTEAVNLPLDNRDGVYEYRVVAFDSANRPSTSSRSVSVVPGDQSEYADFLTWMRQYFGEFESLSCDDPDGDGVDNYHEFLNNTDPTKQPGPRPFPGIRAYGELTLEWEAMPGYEGAVLYQISRGDEIIGTSAECKFTDTGLQAGLTYQYKVRVLESANGGSDWSMATAMQTQKPEKFQYSAEVQKVVDTVLRMSVAEQTGSSLIAAVKSSLEALLGTGITFSVIDEKLLEQFVDQELAVIREITPAMTTAERLALRSELDEMMQKEWSGNSFEHMYIHSKLGELAEAHWIQFAENRSKTSHRDAAQALHEFSLNFMPNHEPSVNNVLTRLGMMQLQSLPENFTDEQLIAALKKMAQYQLRYFDYFETLPPERQMSNPYRQVLNVYWRYFPRLLKYETYDKAFFSSALQMSQNYLAADNSALSRELADKVAAWKLIQLNVTGNASSGKLKLRNVSDKLPVPLIAWDDESERDVREFILNGQPLAIPVYAGHKYEITLETAVNGGPSWIQNLGTVSIGDGGKLIYDAMTGTEWGNLPPDQAGQGELALNTAEPEFPYNLRAEILPDVFTLRWDAVGTPHGFRVFRGTQLIAETAEQFCANIPRQMYADHVYGYTVCAVNADGTEGKRSPVLAVLPEFSPEELQYFEWKRRYFGEAPSLATDDPDGDGLTNYQEFQLGSNPLVAPQEDPKGSLTDVKQGLKVGYYSGLFSSLPDFKTLTAYKSGIISSLNMPRTAGNVLESERADEVALLIQGYFDAPADGDYRFYMVNDDGARLFIDNALLISQNRYGYSDGYGVIRLKKGSHAIRLEYFERNDNAEFQVSWAGPTFSRKVMSRELWHTSQDDRAMAEVAAWLRDSDFDGLTDVEERRFGTDPTKADTDGDGLSDFEEVKLYGSDPLKADSDSDGIGDYEEVMFAFSNPLVADFDGRNTEHQSLNGSSYSSSGDGWRKSGTAAVSMLRNSKVNYALAIPSRGVYVLEVTAAEEFEFATQSEFELELRLGTQLLGKRKLSSIGNAAETVRFFLPELTAGTANVSLAWTNLTGGTRLRVEALKLMSYGGADTNGNGRPDWIDTRMQKLSHTEIARTSATSPLCVEGSVPGSLNLLSVEANAGKKHPYLRLDRSIVWRDPALLTPAERSELALFQPALHASVNAGYYTNIPLSPEEETTISVKASAEADPTLRQVRWTATDVLRDEDVMIRKGDSLLLSANFGDGTPGMGTITVNGEQLAVTGESATPYRFDAPGQYSVTAEFVPQAGGTAVAGELLVTVKEASFAGMPYSIVGIERNWNNAQIPAEAELEHDDLVTLFRANKAAGCNIAFYGEKAGRAVILARLGKKGPVMTSTTMRVVDCRTHKSNGYYQVIDTFPDGTKLIEGEIRLDYVPEDLRIQLVISTSGTSFLDGTIVKWLTAKDFDANGVCRYQMLKNPESPTSTCHSMNYYQGGEFIFSYRNW